MQIYILRHGETALNAKGVMQGRLDEPLNQSGRELAALTGKAIKGIHFDRCISSPLRRARETAELVLRESGNAPSMELDDRIQEIDFGDLEGKNLSEMGEAGILFLSDPFHFAGFPNGELIARDDGKTYLISTHGCAMRAMVHFLTDHPADFWGGHAPYNCSFTIVEAENGDARITAVDQVFYDKSLIVDHYKQ